MSSRNGLESLRALFFYPIYLIYLSIYYLRVKISLHKLNSWRAKRIRKAIKPTERNIMRELFETLTSTMKRECVDPAPFAYMDPCTGEDVYDEEDLYYFYESSYEDFLETAKSIEIPSGISNDIKIEDTDTSIKIWVDSKIALEVDRFSRRVVICDFESIKDRHLYILIDLVRKEVSVPSR
nr:MAG TPA: hypothetical protein [Caudoviricetes sp.]